MIFSYAVEPLRALSALRDANTGPITSPTSRCAWNTLQKISHTVTCRQQADENICIAVQTQQLQNIKQQRSKHILQG